MQSITNAFVTERRAMFNMISLLLLSISMAFPLKAERMHARQSLDDDSYCSMAIYDGNPNYVVSPGKSNSDACRYYCGAGHLSELNEDWKLEEICSSGDITSYKICEASVLVFRQYCHIEKYTVDDERQANAQGPCFTNVEIGYVENESSYGAEAVTGAPFEVVTSPADCQLKCQFKNDCFWWEFRPFRIGSKLKATCNFRSKSAIKAALATASETTQTDAGESCFTCNESELYCARNSTALLSGPRHCFGTAFTNPCDLLGQLSPMVLNSGSSSGGEEAAFIVPGKSPSPDKRKPLVVGLLAGCGLCAAVAVGSIVVYYRFRTKNPSPDVEEFLQEMYQSDLTAIQVSE